MKQKIFIGTSGWNYKHWKENFYPKDTPQKDWLKFYAEKLDTVEINNSFYHLPKEKTFESWKEIVGKNFVYSVKASRYITHMKKLHECRDSVKTFLDRAKILDNKLGPILFQLPPYLQFDYDKLNDFLNTLPKKYKYTIEFRHKSWWKDETYELLKKKNIAFCIYELGKKVSPEDVTADFAYIRFHGPSGKYKGNYHSQTFKKWVKKFKSWEAKEIYCYFDNDEKGYAAKNALRLKEILKRNSS
jgi:uncharacterized protein YecE (DUF72 family)